MKTSIFKNAKVTFLFFVVIIIIFVCLLKQIFPDLKKIKVTPASVDIEFYERANNYKAEADKNISIEKKEYLDDKDNKILSLQKQCVVSGAITAASPTWQIEDSPTIMYLAIGLRDLRESDPNSEIIPLTEGFLMASPTAADVIRKLKTVDGAWVD